MECDRCRSNNLTELKIVDGMETNWCTGEQYEVTTICFKCNDCSFEFTETH